MKIDILTLFPDFFKGMLNESIIKRAIDKKLVEINIINFRDSSPLPNKQVDDTPYGGGAGMLLRCEPIFLALDKIKTKDSHVILLSPEGVTYKQSVANRLKEYKHLIIMCGHYEGFDERIKTLADEIISIGDFILTGGEIAAMAIMDSVVRLIPGVINEESLVNESFNNNLLVRRKPSAAFKLKAGRFENGYILLAEFFTHRTKRNAYVAQRVRRPARTAEYVID